MRNQAFATRSTVQAVSSQLMIQVLRPSLAHALQERLSLSPLGVKIVVHRLVFLAFLASEAFIDEVRAWIVLVFLW